MIAKKRIIPLVVLAFICISPCLAQEVASTSGSHFESQGLQISWTIGEPIIEALANETYSITQGFHQGKLEVTPISSLPLPEVEIAVYPNPAASVVYLSIETDKTDGWSYCLYGADGRLLVEKQVGSPITEIPVQLYAGSNYILKIKENNRGIKSFKIVKSK